MTTFKGKLTSHAFTRLFFASQLQDAIHVYKCFHTILEDAFMDFT